MPSNGSTLLAIVDDVAPRLRAMPAEHAARKPAPGKWSPKEVVGHLIDSATNNHRRFVIAPAMNDLVFAGYDADAWVALQGYQDREWTSIVELWERYNRHVAAVIDRLPPDVVARPHATHSLHEMAWQEVSADTPATLEYLIRDYIGHLEHHLRQILPSYEPVVIGTY